MSSFKECLCYLIRFVLVAFASIFITAFPSNAALADDTPIVGKNLMICSVMGNGMSLEKCEVFKADIAPKQQWESNFKISYSFNCSPGSEKLLDVNLSLDDKKELIPFGKSGEIALEGFGPLQIVDDSVQKTYRSIFYLGCSLAVNSISVTPSVKTINNWKLEITSLESQLSDAEIARDGYAELILYKPALDLIKSITNSLLTDLSRDMELRQKVKSIDPLLLKVITSSGTTFTPEEKSAILDFRLVVASLPPLEDCTGADTSNCKPIILDDLLSDEDKDILNKIAEKSMSAKDAEDNYKLFEQRVIDLSTKLAEVKLIAAPWIS